jgi:hypothetical protein
LDDVSRGEKLLVNEFSDVNVSKASTNELEFEIEKIRIADVTECFVKNNLRIYSIEQKRKLEDYFINMIAEG